MNKYPFFRLNILLVCLIFVSSCKQSESKYSDTPVTGNITIACDQTLKPVIQSEEDVFEGLYTMANLKIQYQSETDIFNLLLKDSIRLIVSNRPLSKNEKDFFRAKKFFPKETKIAVDAIAIIVNNQNADSNLSVQQIMEIFSGKINSWKKINSLSNLGSIELVFDDDNSGIVRYFYDSICKNSKIPSNVFAESTNNEVIEYVRHEKNAIGIIGVSWLSNPNDSNMLSFRNLVKVVGISRERVANSSNSYQPFQAYIATHDYPFTRDVWMINTEPRTGLATGFASFLASDRGQRIILKSGILPVTQPLRIVQVNNELNF